VVRSVAIAAAYNAEGMPFVLYFRKFDFEVLHSPFERAPKLTEDWLRDTLPPEVEVITIQDPDSMTGVRRAVGYSTRCAR
jgi:hypothetical protein